MLLPLLYAATGLLMIGLGIPLVRGAIRPNDYYGFRTPATLASPEIWYRMNRMAGRDLVILGACQVVFAAAAGWLVRQYPSFPAQWAFVGLLLMGTLAMLAHCFSALEDVRDAKRREILDALARGEIGVEDADRQLKELEL